MQAHSRFTAWARHLTADPVVRYGLVLLVVHALWRTSISLGSYFWQDDFRFLADVATGLTTETALQRYNDHLMPGKYVTAWAISGAETDFAPAALTLVAGQVVAAILMLWVLAQLFPGRWVALIGYAMYLFTPLSLVAATWWSYGMEGLPMQIALLGTLGSYLAHRSSGRGGWILAAVAFLAIGLFFYEKALLAPVLVVGFALLVLDTESSFRGRIRTLLSEWRFWLPVGALALAHALYFATAASSGTAANRDFDAVRFFSDALASTLLPGLLGGPWTVDGGLNTLLGAPTRPVVAICGGLWLLLIGYSIHRRGWIAARAWALGGLYIGGLLGLVLWQRADVANFLARDPRYVLDAVPVVVLVALASLTRVSDGSLPSRPAQGLSPKVEAWDLRPSAAVVGVVAMVASAWVTTGETLPLLQHSYSRSYVAALGASFKAEPDVGVVDAPAPPVDVLIRPVSEVVRAMGMQATWDRPGTDLRIVDGLGQLADIDIPNPDLAEAGPQAGCGWRLWGTSDDLELAPAQTEPSLRVVSLGYVAGQSVELAVSVNGGSDTTLTAAQGVGHLLMVTRGPVESLSIDVVGPDEGLCLTDVTVGVPWPARS